jgi:Rrf2 family protein
VRLELTRRADYAIRAVIALAREAPGEALSGPRIAARTGVPTRFLPQVMGDLVRAGLVDATIGRAGGYRLAGDPASLSMLDIIEAVEGDARARTCVLRGGACRREDACDVHEVFASAQDALLGRLRATTVQDIVRPRRPPGG